MTTHSRFRIVGVVAGVVAAASALAVVPALAGQQPDPAAVAAAEARAEAAGEGLGAEIERAIRAGGPFFTARERAVIESACGYPAGSWDGFEANMSEETFVCRDGRRVSTPEVRAVMAAAGPRIGARVGAVMASTEVREAIERVSREATAAALAAVDHVAIARQAAAEAHRAIEAARPEIERASEEARRAVEAARPEIEAAVREAQAASREAIEEARRSVEEAQRARRR